MIFKVCFMLMIMLLNVNIILLAGVYCVLPGVGEERWLVIVELTTASFNTYIQYVNTRCEAST